MRFFLILGVIAMLNTSPAVAVEALSSTRDLYKLCKNKDGDISFSFCLGYMRGFYEATIINMKQISTLKKVAFPPNVVGNEIQIHLRRYSICIDLKTIIDLNQFAIIFTNWAEKNPTKWADPMAIGVYRAIEEAYPCPL